MEKLITLKEYCQAHGKSLQVGHQRIKLGSFKSAIRIGRQWFINKDEPWVDNRIKSGKYKNWRKGQAER